jgi:hypothetical protein
MQPAAPLDTQAPPALGEAAEGGGTGSRAEHHDVRIRIVRHQEGRAKRADHLHRVAHLEAAHVFGGKAVEDAAIRTWLCHALDRQGQVVSAGLLAIPCAADRVQPHGMRPTICIYSRWHNADALPLQHRKRKRSEIEDDVMHVRAGARPGHTDIAAHPGRGE